MLFDDKNILDILITPIEKNKKILTIRKESYMTTDYEDFLVAGLTDTNIADHLFLAQDVSRKKKDDFEEDAVGIIIHDLKANDEVVKYLVTQLDGDYCHLNKIKEQPFDLVSALEDLVPLELKLIDPPKQLLPPVKENKNVVYSSWGDSCEDYDDEEYSDWDYFEDTVEDIFLALDSIGSVLSYYGTGGGGHTPCAGVLKGDELTPSSNTKNTPAYITNFSICPNISVSIMTDMYKEFYTEYMRNLFTGKAFKFKSPEDRERFLEMQRGIQHILHLLNKEITYSSKYLRDCNVCPYQHECGDS